MIADKLKKGDEIRVVAPAKSLNLPWVSEELKTIAKKRFSELGLRLTFSKNVDESNEFRSSSVKSRVSDLHDAFKDKKVKMIITVTGGFNSIELLDSLDYNLIKKNPKIFCGYSDITALSNAIYSRSDLITYYGPNYLDFGDLKGFDYTLEYFKKCFMNTSPYKIESSEKWSDDKWGKDQQNRNFIKNEGLFIINEGSAEGKIIGGNLCTLNLLQGTKYMPSLKNSILFIEDDYESKLDNFNRDLYSLTLLDDFKGVRGIVIGRFQNASELDLKSLKNAIKNNPKLTKIPILANADFGHTTPKITFPIGGKSKISVKKGNISIEIIEH